MEYVDFKDKWGEGLNEVVEKLLRKAGYDQFGLVFEAEESEDNPPGTHGPNLFTLVEASGKVRLGINHWDWSKTAPDGSEGYYRLDLEGEWSEDSIQRKRDRDFSLLKAMEDAGLSITDEEKRRLKWAKERWAKGKSSYLEDYLEETRQQ